MKRLLCIINSMNAGGAETFLMKIYRNIDRAKYQFDFCVNLKEKNFYENEIISRGGKVFRIPSKSENPKEFKKQLGKLIKKENYKYVLRITSNAMGFWDLKIAKKAGATFCCARSSNSSDGKSIKLKVAHVIGRVLYGKYVDLAFAPSELAAKYTFGKRAYEEGKIHILHNAVDLKQFYYDENAKYAIRKEFDININANVYGHVGRFMEQKNHMFLADIFNSIYIKDNTAVFLLVGNGELKEAFEKKIEELGIRRNVIFAGVRSDIPKLLSAMDVFIFPSFYEGMPNAVIEAQATGLPCVIADTITKEADITGLLTYLSLSKSSEEWAEAARLLCNSKRNNTQKSFVINKYDIESTVEKFVQMTLGEKV